ncbi:MAG: hypothetical protein NVSMB27_18260 [Ktedonobacteraceae bacterium]
MNDMMGPINDITEEAVRIIEAARAEGVPLRLLGGLAIYFRCPSAKSDQRLLRPYKDMDFATLGKWSAKTRALFAKLGYTGNKTFNALHGHQRLLFWDDQHERQIDIFIDRMHMCHNLDFRSRLHIDDSTIALTDLLMTKLQIVEINEKDIIDVITIFVDHNVTTSDAGINSAYIASLTSNDWGLYKTFIVNLHKVRSYVIEHGFPAHAAERLQALIAAMETNPKSMAWKARSIVGERVRWYELPEEARQ